MAYDKVVDSVALDATFKGIADAIREKNRTTGNITDSAMAAAINDIHTTYEVEPEVTTYENLLQTAIANLQGKAYPPPVKEGQYVWKKSEIENVVLTNPVIKLIGIEQLQVVAPELSLELLDEAFFDGFHYNGSSYYDSIYFHYDNGVLYLQSFGTDYVVTYDPKTGIITDTSGNIFRENESFIYNGQKSVTKLGDTIGYIVTDNSTAYPDGGELDGYWYEKGAGSEGTSSIQYGTITLTDIATSVTITHSLKGAKKAYLLPYGLTAASGYFNFAVLSDVAMYGSDAKYAMSIGSSSVYVLNNGEVTDNQAYFPQYANNRYCKGTWLWVVTL